MSYDTRELRGLVMHVSTPGGPVQTVTIGRVMARKDAEIHRQRAEVKRLRKELERIAGIETYSRRTWIMAVQAARDALKEDER